MEAIRPLVLEKYQCEYRDWPKLIVQFGIYSLSKFRCKEHNSRFLKSNCPPRVYAVDSDSDGKNEAGSLEKKPVEPRRILRKCIFRQF